MDTNIYEDFTLSLALVDSLSVVIFSVNAIILSTYIRSKSLVAGASIVFWADCARYYGRSLLP